MGFIKRKGEWRGRSTNSNIDVCVEDKAGLFKRLFKRRC